MTQETETKTDSATIKKAMTNAQLVSRDSAILFTLFLYIGVLPFTAYVSMSLLITIIGFTATIIVYAGMFSTISIVVFGLLYIMTVPRSERVERLEKMMKTLGVNE